MSGTRAARWPRLDDEQLLRACRAGDRAAFEEIHRRYRRPLGAYAARILGPRHPAVEDLLQDVFWRLHCELSRNDRPLALRPWLYNVARNRAIDYLRGDRCRERHLTACAPEEPVAEPPWATLVRRQALHETLADLAALPPRQRDALLGSIAAGRSHEELAHELGTTVGGSKSLTNRARVRLLRLRDARRSEQTIEDIDGLAA